MAKSTGKVGEFCQSGKVGTLCLHLSTTWINAKSFYCAMIKVSHMAQVAFLDNINSHILSQECPIASFGFNVMVVTSFSTKLLVLCFFFFWEMEIFIIPRFNKKEIFLQKKCKRGWAFCCFCRNFFKRRVWVLMKLVKIQKAAPVSDKNSTDIAQQKRSDFCQCLITAGPLVVPMRVHAMAWTVVVNTHNFSHQGTDVTNSSRLETSSQTIFLVVMKTIKMTACLETSSQTIFLIVMETIIVLKLDHKQYFWW